MAGEVYDRCRRGRQYRKRGDTMTRTAPAELRTA
jgi:hypothetical protein